jgi:uncharacterized protein YqjF (DUF2071 family)
MTTVPEAAIDAPKRYTDVAALAATPGTRPFPPPHRPWIMAQHWDHVLFCSWPYPVAAVRPLVPAGLDIETFDGTAWVSLVALSMDDVHLRDLPPIPFTTNFPELNLRTYVTCNGRPGVYFMAIDCPNILCSWIGRTVFHTPYQDADVTMAREGDGWLFSSARDGAVRFAASYQPTGKPYTAARGSLDAFLTERYAMFVRTHHGRLLLGAIQHADWPLQDVSVALSWNVALEAAGLPAPRQHPVERYSSGTATIVWGLERA